MSDLTCEWKTGKVGSSRHLCGRPAKVAVRYSDDRLVPVCGTHRRSAERWTSNEIVVLSDDTDQETSDGE
jgi:hypothetical protein